MGSAHCNHTFNARFFQPWLMPEIAQNSSHHSLQLDNYKC